MRRSLVALVALVACGKHEVHWDRKDSAGECAPAIDAWRPGDATPPCTALHMCANEARLSPEQTQRLTAIVAAGKCPAL